MYIYISALRSMAGREVKNLNENATHGFLSMCRVCYIFIKQNWLTWV